jgi:flagellar basal body-associated protein FliL
MPQSENQMQDDRGSARLAIVRTALLQVLVMLAVSGAIIGYLNWSSSVAKADFMRSIEPVLSQSKSSTPMQTAKAPMACYRRA